MNTLAQHLKYPILILISLNTACNPGEERSSHHDAANAAGGAASLDSTTPASPASCPAATSSSAAAAAPGAVAPAPVATTSAPAAGTQAPAATTPAPAAVTTTNVVTFSEIQPVVAANCVSCHGAGGNSPNLSGGQVAVADQENVVKAVTSGSMPFGGSLPQATKDLFAAWAAGGYSRAAAALALLDGTAAAAGTTVCPAGSTANTATSSTSSTDATKDLASLAAYINGLPKPLVIADFIKSLPRPFAVNGTYSQSSLQPACDVDNPRIFIKTGGLLFAVIPRGVVTNQLEIAVSVSDTEQTLAAINFPVTDAVTEESFYQTVLDPKRTTGTGCGGNNLCHVQERPYKVVGQTTAYASHKVTPLPIDVATLGKMYSINSGCNDGSARCQMFNAIFSAQPQPTDYVWPVQAFAVTSIDFVTQLPEIIPELTSADTPGGALINPSTTCARTAALPPNN